MEPIRLRDTHGLLARPGAAILAESGSLGWRGCFASVQTERPYDDGFAGVPAHLLILHLDSNVRVHRWLDGRHEARMVGPGGLFSMPAGRDFRVALGGTLQTVHLYIAHAAITGAAQAMAAAADPFDLPARLGEGDPLLERLILAIRDELLDPGLVGDGYVDTLVGAAAARLVRAAAGRRGPPPTPPRHGPLAARKKIARALDVIEANLDRPLTLDLLAGGLDLGTSQLIALFKEATGLPPHRFIMSRRVARARDLITRGLPLAEVALACGFAHGEHLARVFKREIGVSPGAYRRQGA